MLRPEQMSKISVTGAKSVMDEVIETMHELNVVHISDYDGSWDGFSPGDSMAGANEVSSTLVTVRALENTLDLDEEEIESTGSVDLSDAEERLESVRQRVNDLDDRRDEKRARLREIDEQLDRLELYADLGLDLDLLQGYDSLDVLVGEGDAEAIDAELAEADEVEAFEVFSGTETDAVAAFASMTDGSIEDALVGATVTTYDVPDLSGDPASNVADLRREREAVEDDLEQIEDNLAELKHDEGQFLLALEEDLTIEAQKSEAPLRFATTSRSFIVEGWIPSGTYSELEQTLREAVGDRLEVAELKRAQHKDYGGHHEEEVHDEPEEAVADGGTEDDEPTVATDGGQQEGDVVTVDDEPPVVQNNSRLVNPFEVLVRAVNRPQYSEFDPTITLFLTFPLFFGFMIGDLGYGLLYFLLGYGVYAKASSDGVVKVGAVIAWMGALTSVFGLLYGEVLGLHFLEWFGAHAPIEKGISDPESTWGITWLVLAVVAGWVHLNLAYVFAFVEEIQLEGFMPAMKEVGSWLLLLNGLWVLIFSKLGAPPDGPKPDFLVGSAAELNTGPIGFGFAGFPEIFGWLGILAMVAGVVLLAIGPWYDLFEIAVPLSHTLSYTRLTAILIGKAGMAFTVNLLYFGVYEDKEGFHFMHESTPGKKEDAGKEILFDGIANLGTQVDIGSLTVGIEGALLGLPIYVIGHAVVVAIGGTAAIQAIRLEYFEFFEKFYEGGGRKYEPFGYERTHTTDN